MEDYFFGVWSRSRIGHYLYLPGGRQTNRTPDGFPFTRHEALDGSLMPAGSDDTEGLATFLHINGWTAISFWDRTGDRRGGCSSTFLMKGLHDFGSACCRAKAKFPEVWERFTFTVRERELSA